MKKYIFTAAMAVLALGVSSCETISEDDCRLGAWSEYGYQDGLNGLTSGRVAEYAKKCGEYGVTPDSAAYLESYERGIVRYCTYERGYERGERGDSYNQACSGPLAADFAPGYDAGRAIFNLHKEHDALIAEYDNILASLDEVRRKLREDQMDDGERRRLIKKEGRFEREAEEKRVDIRTFERMNNLPKHSFY